MAQTIENGLSVGIAKSWRSLVSSRRSVMKVTDCLFLLTVKVLVRSFFLSRLGVDSLVLQRSDVMLLALLACQRIISVLYMPLPKPIAK